MNASTNLITPYRESNEESNPSTSKVTFLRSSNSKVTPALVPFTLTSNVVSHDSIRPKRRSHHASTCSKIYPPIKNSPPSPSLLQVNTTLERKESSASMNNSSSSPHMLSLILTSWDA